MGRFEDRTEKMDASIHRLLWGSVRADALYGVSLRLNEGSREMEVIEQSSVEDLGLSSEQMKNSSEVWVDSSEEFFHSSEEREISSEELVDFLRAIWAFAPRNWPQWRCGSINSVSP